MTTAINPVAGASLQVPEGWQLVPKVPTVEQECAPDHEDCATPDAARAIYTAMLAAAPPSPLDTVTVKVIGHTPTATSGAYQAGGDHG